MLGTEEYDAVVAMQMIERLAGRAFDTAILRKIAFNQVDNDFRVGVGVELHALCL
jgi:hypothetical protein